MAVNDDDAAMRDNAAILAADGDYNADALINMTLILAKHHDLAGQLALANAHPYLYELDGGNKNQLAILLQQPLLQPTWNSGSFQQAMDDCTISLRLDSIPDAYAKQQRLIKMLAGK